MEAWIQVLARAGRDGMAVWLAGWDEVRSALELSPGQIVFGADGLMRFKFLLSDQSGSARNGS